MLLAALISNESNSLTTIAAIVGIWHGKAKLRTDAGNLTPIQRLALLIAETALHPSLSNESAYKRLWNVYISVVEVQFGSHMDEAKERAAIETMAQICANLDTLDDDIKKSKEHGNTLRKGLTADTADDERFIREYERVIMEDLKRQKS
ncbi:hypothetical protein [Burkholderia pseudomallei]|uniref:hypothetical protein n=1 Tax=Burkholderia pseudomallei TaxID=28450 RepID=UPI0012F4C9A0|nr:hypothetical protein [Burkholderia pseudomallei]